MGKKIQIFLIIVIVFVGTGVIAAITTEPETEIEREEIVRGNGMSALETPEAENKRNDISSLYDRAHSEAEKIALHDGNTVKSYLEESNSKYYDTANDNVKHTTNSNQCSLFCDSSGYQPNWVGSMGQWQALSKCESILVSANDYFEYLQSKDGIWCEELTRWQMDHMFDDLDDVLDDNVKHTTNSNQCSLFCDSSGYQPNWVGSMGQWQALSKCESILVSANDYFEYLQSKDEIWCEELTGWQMDHMFDDLDDVLDDNVKHTTNSNQCSLFCDSSGYQPNWVSSMGQWQALSKCESILVSANDYFEYLQSKDGIWCEELTGWQMDHMFDDLDDVLDDNVKHTTNSNQCSLFCDSSGYQPNWVSSMGQWQALSKCESILVSANDYFEYLQSKDGIWCEELTGWQMDHMFDDLDDVLDDLG